MFGDHHGELAALLPGPDRRPGRQDQPAKRPHRADGRGDPAAWGINADGTTGPGAGTGPDAAVLPAAARLAEIPGISPMLARAIIAEVGLDMARFPTAGHLVSRAGLCPSARQSGPRTRAGKKGQGNGYLRASLGQAATGAARTATFLGERYHRIARRRGTAKAQVAVARSILVIISLAPARQPRNPVHRPRPRLLPGPHRYRPQAPQPHPANPGPRLRRHHRQDRLNPQYRHDQARRHHRPGSAAARPFTVDYFPVSWLPGPCAATHPALRPGPRQDGALRPSRHSPAACAAHGKGSPCTCLQRRQPPPGWRGCQTGWESRSGNCAATAAGSRLEPGHLRDIAAYLGAAASSQRMWPPSAIWRRPARLPIPRCSAGCCPVWRRPGWRLAGGPGWRPW
jgi:Transposase IS116/IS110/IS902 family